MLTISRRMRALLERTLPDLQPGEVRRLLGLGLMHAAIAGTAAPAGQVRVAAVTVAGRDDDLLCQVGDQPAPPPGPG